MGKSLRLSEKWFHRGLWLVALVFAGFLTGLGSTVVGDLPRVEKQLTLDDFIDIKAAEPLRMTLAAETKAAQAVSDETEQAQLKLNAAEADTLAARETFDNWLATRQVTQQGGQDAELVKRTQALDVLKGKERKAKAAVEAQQQIVLNARLSQGAREQLEELEQAAQAKLDVAYRAVELRVFLYRLALTLPLLVVAGWLFAKKRKSTYWPFVWGFIFFALFAFFVELVPYMPSYGGYVRYVVGIIVTVLIGRQAIVSLNRYLEKLKLAEQLPDVQRREELSYDTALTRLSKAVCPGCERAVDLKSPDIDFCQHCGISLFDHCQTCNARKSAFAKFCYACGTGAGHPRKLLPELPVEAYPATATT